MENTNKMCNRCHLFHQTRYTYDTGVWPKMNFIFKIFSLKHMSFLRRENASELVKPATIAQNIQGLRTPKCASVAVPPFTRGKKVSQSNSSLARAVPHKNGMYNV
ncbi:unnamed protein product [Ixodes pacificus]